MDFPKFAQKVNDQISRMGKNNTVLFEVNSNRDIIWETYLKAFPEGTNPLFRERTEHDCNCCKNFIRDVGSMVSIDDNGNYVTIWDIKIDSEYQVVADAMSQYVRSLPIKGVFFFETTRVGNQKTRAMTEGTVVTYDHFYATLPKYVVPARGTSIGAAQGRAQSDFEVLERSIEEISVGSIDIVLELIGQNSLYRGQEHKNTVQLLADTMDEYAKAPNKANFIHRRAAELKGAGRFRNTVIGTLLVDISDGVELERAVASFEQKVAPSNYKRTSALVTPGMVKKAQEKVQELGIADSLYRRYARSSDMTVNNVLFADRSARVEMGDDVFAELAKESKKAKTHDLKKVQEVTVKEFIDNILPKAEKLELFLENKHKGNLVSLVAPFYEDAPNILKWNNSFSWSYAGEVTDSIKERVKKAGGVVDAPVRASLSWYNYDDLDLHVRTPGGGHIYFHDKVCRRTGGCLDVDMNAGSGKTRDAVENVFWRDIGRMKDGTYKVQVNNFHLRERKDVGFQVQIDINGEVHDFYYDKLVPDGSTITVANIIKKGDTFTIKPEIESTVIGADVWGVKTQDWVPVTMVMNSPNHWDDQEIGNKHWFFILKDCVNPDETRGLYNEFLRNDLNEHRKVFEVLGGKIKCPHTDDQLSGVGFSSTKTNHVMVKVSGSFNRTVKVNF